MGLTVEVEMGRADAALMARSVVRRVGFMFDGWLGVVSWLNESQCSVLGK